jgi:hypothetical protein
MQSKLTIHQGQPAAAVGAIAAKQKLIGFDPASRSVNVNLSGTFNDMQYLTA